jgi:RimJ/RimL family protein N-acetyltransferase
VSVPPGTMWRVPLREVRSEDIPVFYAYQADPEANALAGVPSRDRDAYEAHWAKLRADPEVLLRTIVTENGTVAGQLLSFPRDGVREIGYWLGRRFWGRGIATAALAEFLPLVTERPLYGVVSEPNIASRRVLERNGFVLAERHERESLLPDGPPVPVLVFRLDG